MTERACAGACARLARVGRVRDRTEYGRALDAVRELGEGVRLVAGRGLDVASAQERVLACGACGARWLLLAPHDRHEGGLYPA